VRTSFPRRNDTCKLNTHSCGWDLWKLFTSNNKEKLIIILKFEGSFLSSSLSVFFRLPSRQH
jgi:hypothetical protein